MRTYTYGYTRLKHTKGEGFRTETDGALSLTGGRRECRIYLKCLDGVDEDCRWGRLSMDASLGENSILTVYAAAGRQGKENRIGPFVNQTDILLCDLTGRYLWIWLEIKNADKGVIRNIRVLGPGTEVLQMMPEVYRERGSVLHRYLSIFSSIHMDAQKKFEKLEETVDVWKAPVRMLPVLGEWLGIRCGEGLLSEKMTRTLLARAYEFRRIRGTPRVVRELVLLLAGEEPKLLEKEPDIVVVLLKRKITEELELKLLYFLMQFVPAGCRLHIVSFQDVMGLDEYYYLDVNASLKALEEGKLDSDCGLDQCMME